ncbi:MAG: 2OG-Fe(II) oxygenase [Alphaproteobacteria bacterium]|nr:2OG-Fe(II) oxygenase [Alphaproteobacteria bacterium]
MAASEGRTGGLMLGDPVPWFSAATIAGGRVDLHVDAGRWIVLAFLGRLERPRAAQELAELLAEAPLFDPERLVVYVVLTAPPGAEQIAALASISGPALAFIADYDGVVTQCYGASATGRTVVLDPMLRAVADISWEDPGRHAAMVRGLLRGLPDIDASAGVPLGAPALIVPRVFDFPLCDFLAALHEREGGVDSGFLLDRNGRTETVIDHRLKRRQDLVIVDPELREIMRDRIVRRLLPAVERYLQFNATRMDRAMVSCYDAATRGHFSRHRDNINAGAEHRRFAVSLSLNKDYDGGELVFPEFGRRSYRPPSGGAIVFSCGALHEVTPVTRGRRYVFVPFLYGEEDAARRLENNARLAAGEAPYLGDRDRLYPDPAPS